MRLTLIFVAALVTLLVATGCTSMSAEAQAVVDELVRTGRISQEQADIIQGQEPWLPYVITSLASIAAALFGVPIVTNLQRGPVTARKGFAPPAAPGGGAKA